jgi:hypothetical protein
VQLDSIDRKIMKNVFMLLTMDGREPTPEQWEKFDMIGSSFKGFKTERRNIIKVNERENSTARDFIIKDADNDLSWNEEEREIEQRKMLWALTSLLYYYGEYSDEKRDIVRSLAGKWGLDKSIFYEMKDTAETYAALASYQNRVEDWDGFLKNELNKNKKELERSINEFITLG